MSQSQFVMYALLAGLYGALSGACGKLSVGDDVPVLLVLRGVLFAANGVCTGQMWRYYLKALSLGSTTTAQMINTGANFSASALFGILIFGEQVSTLWMVGAAVTCVGLALVASDPALQPDKKDA
jgi:uncharacterized membrane protein